MANIDQVVETIIRLNSAWLNGRYDDLRQHFHPDCVMLPPPPAEPIRGVDAMVESYRRFGAAGTVHSFETLSTDCLAFDGFVVGHLRFRIDYEIASGRFVEEGVEAYVLTPTDPPRVVWRTQLSAPKRA